MGNILVSKGVSFGVWSEKVKQQEVERGSITVFISLILFMVLALVLTTIEGARISIAKTFAERALYTAMDSILAEFYGPLLEDYHLFGMDSSYGRDTVQEEYITEQLQNYMSYTFRPNQNRKDVSLTEGAELYQVSVDNLSIVERTNIVDYKGELFFHETVAYMKYEKVTDIIELFLDKLSLLETPKKVSYIYEEKQKVEKELVEIDQGILQLMELLDGLKTNNRGLELTKDGSLKTVTYFVKKISLDSVTKESVGINNETIFDALKNNYSNSFNEFSLIEENIRMVEVINQNIEMLNDESIKVRFALNDVNDMLKELNAIKDKSKLEKAKVKSLTKEKKELENKRDNIQYQIRDYIINRTQYVSDILMNYNILSNLIKETILKIEQTMPAIEKIIQKTSKAELLIKSYEEYLYGEKDGIGEDVYQGLEEELTELKKYTVHEKGYDFLQMKNVLEQNLYVLSEVFNNIQNSELELFYENYGGAKECFRLAKNSLANYKIKELSIDYSTLVLSKQKENNPIGMIGSLVEDGILGLVINPDTISQEEMTGDIIPSVIAALSGDMDVQFDIFSFFNKLDTGKSNTSTGNIFQSFGEESTELSVVGKGINTLIEQLLFQEYMIEHFQHYQRDDNKKASKPSVLTYEQEYLLAGKTKDKDNIASVITRIVFLRTVLDFVSILGDKEKCNEAKIAAATLVGFTGLPILVSITKTLILLVWAFAEALVDTCALLLGNKVPMIKKPSDLMVNFPDLLLLSRSMIEKKAEDIKISGPLTTSYQDYLRFFLLTKNKQELSYRSMDLIQENIRIRYDDTFSLNNCLFGFKVNASFVIESKIAQLSFMNKFLSSSPKGFQYDLSCTYSY